MTELDVSELLVAAIGDPPAAQFDLDQALRVGQKRRRSRQLVSAVSTLVVVGAVALGGWWTSNLWSVSAHHPDRVSATYSPSPLLKPPPPATVVRPTARQIESLALAIAKPTGGRITVQYVNDYLPGNGTIVRAASLYVSLGGKRAFSVSAEFSADDTQNVGTWVQSCAFDNAGKATEGIEARTCKQLSYDGVTGVWDVTQNAPQAGRRLLRFARSYSYTDSVTVTVDNYVESPSGPKFVGIAWPATGITPAGISAAMTRVLPMKPLAASK
jgi:hypothetical protein